MDLTVIKYRYLALPLAILLAESGVADQDTGIDVDESVTAELTEVLDRLEDLGSNATTEPFDRIIAVGPAALPMLCERLMRPAMFDVNKPSSQEMVSNLSFAFLALKQRYPETVPQSVDCLFRWSLDTDDRDPSRPLVQSNVAVLFGDEALAALVAAWQKYSADGELFERSNSVGNGWFRFFCNRDGKEVETIDELAQLADGLEQHSRLNLYSHISTLASCSGRATEVIEQAFNAETNADAKRTLYRIRMQARKLSRR